MEKEIVNQVQEAQRVPYRINPRRNTPRHILIKLRLNTKKILKAAREKQQVTYKGNPICLKADLSAETLQARREWKEIFKVLKGKKTISKIAISGKDLIKNEWRNQKLFRKTKLRKFSTMKPALQQMLKGTYIVKKYKRRKKIYKMNPKQLRKWQ